MVSRRYMMAVFWVVTVVVVVTDVSEVLAASIIRAMSKPRLISQLGESPVTPLQQGSASSARVS
jgi:hypothetical protein